VASEIAQQGDTVIMLSSELIAEVMEQYFNKAMFKKRVKITDLKPTEQGYAFSLAFVDKEADKQFNEVVKQVYEAVYETDEAGEQSLAQSILDSYDRAIQDEDALTSALLNGGASVALRSMRDNKGRFTKRR
jgi:hypothetical protein